jgi:hypothetical protein
MQPQKRHPKREMSGTDQHALQCSQSHLCSMPDVTTQHKNIVWRLCVASCSHVALFRSSQHLYTGLLTALTECDGLADGDRGQLRVCCCVATLIVVVVVCPHPRPSLASLTSFSFSFPRGEPPPSPTSCIQQRRLKPKRRQNSALTT